jgi:hypothetical protein
MQTIKFISKDIYNYIISANRQNLERMADELEKEINDGILTDVKYTKELELIKSRLK